MARQKSHRDRVLDSLSIVRTMWRVSGLTDTWSMLGSERDELLAFLNDLAAPLCAFADSSDPRRSPKKKTKKTRAASPTREPRDG